MRIEFEFFSISGKKGNSCAKKMIKTKIFFKKWDEKSEFGFRCAFKKKFFFQRGCDIFSSQ